MKRVIERHGYARGKAWLLDTGVWVMEKSRAHMDYYIPPYEYGPIRAQNQRALIHDNWPGQLSLANNTTSSAHVQLFVCQIVALRASFVCFTRVKT